MVPQKANGFEVIAAIEIETSFAAEQEWYIVADRGTEGYAQRYVVWKYNEWKGMTAFSFGFYTDERSEALENMIRRSGFALDSRSH